MKSIGIYIHIPFCDSKCSYCDFKSYAFNSELKDSKVNQYMEALHKEIEIYKDELSSYEITSIYFGGGTPSSIDPEHISKVLSHLKSTLDITPECEITLEVNPGTMDSRKIEIYKKAGVNRISLGLQTTNNTLLQLIGRKHDFETFLETYNAFVASGISNISLDLMFGLPGQTIEHLTDSLNKIIEINPNHVSVYALKLEEGTPMYLAYEKGLIQLPDEEIERNMYHIIIEKLRKAGIEQYEISNFSKPGFESRHNLTYWENKPYLGLGLSSHSKMNLVRFANNTSLSSYMRSLAAGLKPIIESDTINTDEDLFETIMLGLRLNKGISKSMISQKYNIDFDLKYNQVLDYLVKNELILNSFDTVQLTEKGMDLSNRVFVEFMDE